MSDLEEYLNRSVGGFFGLSSGMKRILAESGVHTVKDLLDNFNLDDVVTAVHRVALQQFKEDRLKEIEKLSSQEVAGIKIPELPKVSKTAQIKKGKPSVSDSQEILKTFFAGAEWYGGLAPPAYEELERVEIPWENFLRHTFICGGTGSGKTVLVKSLLEQAATNGIPSVVIDPAGDYIFLALAEALNDDKSLTQCSERYAKDYGPETSDENSVKYWMREFLDDKKIKDNSGISCSEIKNYKENVFVRIFTPGNSRYGTSLALPSIDGHLLQRDATENDEEYRQRINEIVLTMVRTLGVAKKNEERFATFLREIIDNGDFEGCSGDSFLEQLTQLLPQCYEILTSIGSVSIEDFISRNEVQSLQRDLATYREGTKSSWLKGIKFDLRLLTTKVGNRVPINVVCIQHLELREQQEAIARITSNIGRWMFEGEGAASGRPRLLLSIDELGGGGGTEAVFPPVAIPVSKPPLLRLIRQGRKYGIGLILATQNVKDIDYRGLSNVNSWFVGKLNRQIEQKTIQDALSTAVDIGSRINKNEIQRVLPGLKEGMFIYVGDSGKARRLRGRWIKSLHLKPSLDLQEKLVCKLREAVVQHVNNLDLSNGPFEPNLEFALFEDYQERLLARLLEFEEIKEIGQYEAFKWLVDTFQSCQAIEQVLTFIKKTKFDDQGAIEQWVISNKLIDREVGTECLEYLAVQSIENGDYEQATHATANISINLKRKNVFLKFIERISKWSLKGKEIHEWQSLDNKNISKIKDHSFVVDEVPELKVKKLIKSIKSSIHSEITKLDEKVLKRWLDQVKSDVIGKGVSKVPRVTPDKEPVDRRMMVERVIEIIIHGDKIDISKLGLSNMTSQALNEIDPIEFEIFIAKILNMRGYETELTKRVGDDGVDVLAYDKSNSKIAIQCKRYNNTVGPGVIRDMHGAQKVYNCDVGLVVTTSTFSDQARETAEKLNMGLLDGNDIAQILI